MSAGEASSTWRSTPQPATLQQRDGQGAGSNSAGCVTSQTRCAGAEIAKRRSLGSLHKPFGAEQHPHPSSPDGAQRRGIGQQQAGQASASSQVQAGALGEGRGGRLQAWRVGEGQGSRRNMVLWVWAASILTPCFGSPAVQFCPLSMVDMCDCKPPLTLGVQLAAAKEVGLLQRPTLQLAGRQVEGAAVDGLELTQPPAEGGKGCGAQPTKPH